MPSNKDKTGNRGRWQPGESGNPSGRPRIPKEFIQAAREASLEAIQVVISIARNNRAEAKDRLKAVEIILSRAWGQPSDNLGKCIAEEARKLDLSPEELKRQEEAIAKSNALFEEAMASMTENNRKAGDK